MKKQTAVIAESIQSGANRLYVERARRALPLLIVQARFEQPTTYEDLARALDMKNPRNLNFVLGAIGTSLVELSALRGESIPPIQSLVVKKSTQLPGVGFDSSGQAPRTLRRASPSERRRIVDQLWDSVFSYAHWDAVAHDLGLSATKGLPLPLPRQRKLGAGEGRAHKAFKAFILERPQLFGLPAEASAHSEVLLPSGDRLDVLFRDGDRWLAVEVKSRCSDNLDLRRGLYQCIKYEAVLQAWRAHDDHPSDVKVVLASESPLPRNILKSATRLGITWRDDVRPPAA